MAKITPVLDGKLSPLHGSFVVGPGLSAGLDLDGIRINFEFIRDADRAPSADLVTDKKEATIKIYNYMSTGAFDVTGFIVDGVSVTLHLSFTIIGDHDPHRLITYTVSAA